MTDVNVKGVKQDWRTAQNDALIEPDNLVDLIKFLARRAAERDFEQQIKAQSDPPDKNGDAND